MKYKSTPSKRTKHLAMILSLIPNMVLAQQGVIVFHNCENFFYPTKDTIALDDDFTAEGKKRWTFSRYNTKKNLLAKTYIAAGKGTMPAIIGLCEIENDKVLYDLCKDTPLRKENYKYIHYSSEDVRGIDVALLYNEQFSPISHSKLVVEISEDEEKTRDVLYVQGMLKDLKLNIYVIHAPSRREHNIKKALRTKIFSMVYHHIEELRAKGEENFIIMGDLNDEPWDTSVKDGFNTMAHRNNPDPLLVNLMQNNKNKRGAYVYNGQYCNFDQFIVSKPLLKHIETDNKDEEMIFRPQFLVDNNRNNRLIQPLSTYKGMSYQGGASDHFPIRLFFKNNSKK
jgi:hypothetical protein